VLHQATAGSRREGATKGKARRPAVTDILIKLSGERFGAFRSYGAFHPFLSFIQSVNYLKHVKVPHHFVCNVSFFF
jgi:hypothetical protein